MSDAVDVNAELPLKSLPLEVVSDDPSDVVSITLVKVWFVTVSLADCEELALTVSVKSPVTLFPERLVVAVDVPESVDEKPSV